MNEKIPIRYVPGVLSKQDRKKQITMLNKSKKLYKNDKYYTREKLQSYRNKTSKHIINARKIYNLQTITPSNELSKATGCSVKALEQIVKKGEGAYFSSGSRPNQTAQSWGLARLASSLTGGKASLVDYHIIDKGCHHNKVAFKMANESKKKYTNKDGKIRRTKKAFV